MGTILPDVNGIRKIGLETLLRQQLAVQERLRADYPDIHPRFPKRIQISPAYFTQLQLKLEGGAMDAVSVAIYDDRMVYVPIDKMMTFETPNVDHEITGVVDYAAYGKVGQITADVSKGLGYANLDLVLNVFTDKAKTVKPEGFYSVIALKRPIVVR